MFLKRPPPRGAAGWAPGELDPRAPAARLATEAAALELLSGSGATPRLLTADPIAGFLVIEALEGTPVDAILLGDHPAACVDALVGLYTTLGRMHAWAAPRVGDFERRRAALTGAPLVEAAARVSPHRVEAVGRCQALGVPLTAESEAQMDGASLLLDDPGPYTTLVHGDPCPDNALAVAAGVKLCDFEGATRGHALLDGAYLRTGWPTCWCAHSAPAAVVTRAEAAYRAALAEGVEAARDDESWTRALAMACLAHVWFTLSVHLERALDEDPTWGVTTVRARVLSRLVLARQPVLDAGWPAVADWLDRVGEVLGARWGESALVPFPPLRAEAR